jgi:uncharacterized phage-like protein YoqJ
MIVAGTGHRPNKLGGYGKDAQQRLIDLAIDFFDSHAGEQVTEVISGMALGWDMALAEAACQLEIPWTAAIPFEGQQLAWPRPSQEAYEKTLVFAKNIVYVCEPGYAAWKMQKRNEWMVDNCDAVLALWDGSDGGTGNCIKYANKINKPIINLWENYNNG